MKIYTIGFTQKSAEDFFGRIRRSGTDKILDVRLNNVSQLAGFAKKDDISFFAKEICNVGYAHVKALAPEQKMLDEYKKSKISWEDYEKNFIDLMTLRKIENLKKDEIDGSCLLCSEDKPHHCHRRLVAEYLREHWEGVEIEHL